LKPVTVLPHTRDVVLLGITGRGHSTKGSVSYLIEDSWPRLWVSLGWHATKSGVDVVLALGKTNLDYDDLLQHESIAQSFKDGMRFYKANDKYILTVRCDKEGANYHLTMSLLPQNMDFWAWEKYYKQNVDQSASVQKVDFQGTTTNNDEHKFKETSVPFDDEFNPNLDNEQGIFERKNLLSKGKSYTLKGNRTERELMARESDSVGTLVRLENWSKEMVGAPSYAKFNYGQASNLFPFVSVRPGNMEISILKQSSQLTGISGVIRWPVGDGSTIISLMVSVPYNPHVWSTWVAIGIFTIKEQSPGMRMLPGFDAMYSGTPDSEWFVRSEIGRRLEFANEKFILILDSDASLSKPVIHLALLPVNPDDGAESVQLRLAGKLVPEDNKERISKSIEVSALSGSSSSSQCQCPCICSGERWGSSIFTLLVILLQFLQY